MIARSITEEPAIPELAKSLNSRVVLLLVVAGSQLGMLALAALYVQFGRLEDVLSLEAVLGAAAIVLSLLVWRVYPFKVRADRSFLWLAGFLLVGSLGEVLRSDVRLGNVSTFISIGAFYLLGRTGGRQLVLEGGRLPALRLLLGIYLLWYLILLIFLVKGDLGFYGELPYSDLKRLEFTEGFKATELAIPVGFQLPVIFYAILSAPKATDRGLGLALLVCASALVVATASAAAIVACGIVVMVFIVAWTGSSAKTLGMLALTVVTLAAVAVLAFSNGIVVSAEQKLLDYSEGEGIRALIYADLAMTIVQEPLGIGKGRFVERNDFSWTGEGVYPHQNILGVGAELGIPALLLFTGFCLSVVIKLGRYAWGERGSTLRSIRLIAAVALGAFLYQQFRGLFQDTWVFRETYYWAGLGLGAISEHVRQLAHCKSSRAAIQVRGR